MGSVPITILELIPFITLYEGRGITSVPWRLLDTVPIYFKTIAGDKLIMCTRHNCWLTIFDYRLKFGVPLHIALKNGYIPVSLVVSIIGNFYYHFGPDIDPVMWLCPHFAVNDLTKLIQLSILEIISSANKITAFKILKGAYKYQDLSSFHLKPNY